MIDPKFNALPKWWGVFLFFLAGVFAFPAIGLMIEASQTDLWLQKIETMGVLYTVGIIFWSFIGIILCAIFIGIGAEILRNHDPKVKD